MALRKREPEGVSGLGMKLSARLRLFKTCTWGARKHVPLLAGSATGGLFKWSILGYRTRN